MIRGRYGIGVPPHDSKVPCASSFRPHGGISRRCDVSRIVRNTRVHAELGNGTVGARAHIAVLVGGVYVFPERTFSQRTLEERPHPRFMGSHGASPTAA